MIKDIVELVGYKVDEFRLWLAGVIMPGMVKNAGEHYGDAECEFVREMFDKFGFPHRDTSPGPIPEWQLLQRAEFMFEEFNEFLGAAGVIVEPGENGKWTFKMATYPQQVPDMADALVDLVYFAKGTAVAMGLPWGHLFDDVHECNMSKIVGKTKRGFQVDLAKPPGWEPPRTEEILFEHGWDPSTPNDVGDKK